jgi:hypothetical protein
MVMVTRRQTISPRHVVARLRESLADLRGIRQDVDTLLVSADSASAAAEDAAACRSELRDLRIAFAEQAAKAASDHDRTVLALRIVRDADAAARSALWSLRSTPAYAAAYEEDEPLVTIIISTYTNWALLRDRSLPSVLAQTYEHWETIVVGDAAPDEAREAVESFGDPRIRFVNLPYRGPYPDKPADAWLVSGTMPWNTGLALAKGQWIGTNGDDDELRPRYIESLLEVARSTTAEVPYGYINQRDPHGSDIRLGTFPPVHSQWGLQASLIHSGLKFLSMQPSDWIFGIPNDSSLLERMLRIGVRFSFLEDTVVDYFPSSLWGIEENRASGFNTANKGE